MGEEAATNRRHSCQARRRHTGYRAVTKYAVVVGMSLRRLRLLRQGWLLAASLATLPGLRCSPTAIDRDVIDE